MLYYRRYVDGIICCFQNSHDADMCFQYLNKCHPNIKFRMETETDGKLPFLDVLLSKQRSSNNECSCITSVFRKKDLLHWSTYKLFQFYSHSVQSRVNYSSTGHIKLTTLPTILRRNMFPSYILPYIGFYSSYTRKENFMYYQQVLQGFKC